MTISRELTTRGAESPACVRATATHNNHEGGATFTVTLRRSDSPGILSGQQGAA